MCSKQLARRHDGRWLAGVAGGLADYWGIDALIVRLAFIVLSIFTVGIALAIYVVAWLLMPDALDGTRGLDTVQGWFGHKNNGDSGHQTFNPYSDAN